jgi:hypothetical protein
LRGWSRLYIKSFRRKSENVRSGWLVELSLTEPVDVAAAQEGFGRLVRRSPDAIDVQTTAAQIVLIDEASR